MAEKQKIINIAVIAHVDAGKSTLVDAFLNQSGVFRENEEVVDCVMDSDDIERERGITIYSKNCSIMHGDTKINIVDTPGHADFSSEVERIMKTVDTVILLVDSSEGPMPQTRFVLSKSLEQGLNPILLINKIDKKDARIDEVVDEVYELFMDLNANDEQLDFPILYGIARQGIAVRDPEEVKGIEVGEGDKKLRHTPRGIGGLDITPLFDTIVEHCAPYPDLRDEPLQFQVSTLAYDDYIGRLGIGRITRGVIREGQTVAVAREDGTIENKKINQVFVYRGLKRMAVPQAECGDIVVVSGISDISIGETICDPSDPQPMEMIHIEEPTLSMNFMVNTSPFAGRVGKYVTSRHIRERLNKELEVNVGLLVEDTDSTDCFKVSGRGELHLSILIENMRREGYELAVSKPEVIFHKDENGRKLEPVEEVVINVPDEYSGSVISKLNQRKGMMVQMSGENGYSRLEYHVPTRGLLGYRSEFINDTRGEGSMERRFFDFEPYKGEIPGRTNGVAIAIEEGNCTPYALFNIGERVQMFVEPGTHVYEGMIVGMNSRSDDMDVNPCKAKKVSNMRAAGSDETIKLSPPRTFTLEEALEFIADDELVEVTPDDIRLRKKLLHELDRRRAGR
ncbi:translational GTPase TypA [Hornefia butyriciproducens]|jgi:GTP-binding protein|uniref:Large ribosomal subunit assembly factor BipA n=2 Tax=Hornefia butyriciproducens TaxID=2652293 RepID=A0A6L5Y7B2_9FIRM|nr:translational GTPase TypA [Hornefia butyriciproducens]MCI7327829.1 translational GTPase TypA [Clostridiales bacterium]MCI7412957.1 translational GTPase TypA [Clostridiales bacterium]MDD7020530.1 translational GTPase TypA [Hornefia butyriciproducens]MDY5424161.1 translational GTPase TypA [Hornefia butyriciproducens]MDY6211169.1 translational GTPase TypA [Hornefia butyriciproducens]